jgi:hypothetical protein
MESWKDGRATEGKYRKEYDNGRKEGRLRKDGRKEGR